MLGEVDRRRLRYAWRYLTRKRTARRGLSPFRAACIRGSWRLCRTVAHLHPSTRDGPSTQPVDPGVSGLRGAAIEAVETALRHGVPVSALRTRFERILADVRLDDESADESQLIAEYGSDSMPEAIYMLREQYEWDELLELVLAVLRDDSRSEHWETAQVVLSYAANDHKLGACHCPMPTDSTIALLYHRFPGGIDDGDRIWSIVCALKEPSSDYEPLEDPKVQNELRVLRGG